MSGLGSPSLFLSLCFLHMVSSTTMDLNVIYVLMISKFYISSQYAHLWSTVSQGLLPTQYFHLAISYISEDKSREHSLLSSTTLSGTTIYLCIIYRKLGLILKFSLAHSLTQPNCPSGRLAISSTTTQPQPPLLCISALPPEFTPPLITSLLDSCKCPTS